MLKIYICPECGEKIPYKEDKDYPKISIPLCYNCITIRELTEDDDHYIEG